MKSVEICAAISRVNGDQRQKASPGEASGGLWRAGGPRGRGQSRQTPLCNGHRQGWQEEGGQNHGGYERRARRFLRLPGSTAQTPRAGPGSTGREGLQSAGAGAGSPSCSGAFVFDQLYTPNQNKTKGKTPPQVLLDPNPDPSETNRLALQVLLKSQPGRFLASRASGNAGPRAGNSGRSGKPPHGARHRPRPPQSRPAPEGGRHRTWLTRRA
ncbi:hypothetical protein SKAU_G00398980 [Synaphobranchus kaupii]|uniref:Uncharacterized protein n=1 Tax=Synaphobranchus kaupii TaxID=118154 RepID=A0A9Q1IC52_SYNKA|nr:hypothetical protein SKAU_G00398980 [Synaphobranchus kaupii]